MSNQFFETIPAGVGHPKEDYQQQMLAARDCIANAITFGGTEGIMYTVRIDDTDYLLFGHNGKPFQDEENLINSAKWCRTTSNNNSLWGQGLKFIACNCVRGVEYAELVLASHCPDGKFRSVRAKSNLTDGRKWEINVEDWESRIKKIVGDKFFYQYHVYYLFRCDWDMNKTFTCLKPAAVSAFWLSAPGFYEKFHFVCGEKQIGRTDYPATREHTIAETVKLYSSIEAAKKGISGTGSASRPVPSERYFHEAFRSKRFTFSCNPFLFQYADVPESAFQVTKAEITIELYPGLRCGNWLLNHRDVITDQGNPSKQGAISTYQKPYWTAFLYAPYCKRGAMDCFSRYGDNAMYFGAAGDFMRSLGLPMPISHKPPFVIVRISINEVSNRVIGHKIEPTSPTSFETIMGANPDFTFQNQFSKSLMDAACEAAKANVPPELITELEKMFPTHEAEWLPIGSGDGGPPPNPFDVRIFDVEATAKTGKITEFDGQLPLDGRKILILKDQKERELFSEVTKSAKTRGVEIKKVCHDDLSAFLGKEIAHAAELIATQV